jgi:DNA-binding CsgD family transcriptional regulator
MEGLGTDSRGGAGLGLIGRESECAALDQVTAALRAGESGVLVVRGGPGIGKSALLDHAIESSSGLRVLRATGVESEMELAFAALHQLCAPLLDQLDGLPLPQRDALETVFGMKAGAPPDRFLVGLAVLSLLADVSQAQPLLCVMDDAQWLDRASAQVLAFVARRLVAESVAFLFGTRQPDGELLGLPQLEVTGLRAPDSHALLNRVMPAGLDQRIRDRIVAETHGNPLALLELPRGLSVTEMAGGLGLLQATALPGRIEESFLARIDDLPESTRTLLLVASAEPLGDPGLVWRAAHQLGVVPETALAGGTDGLLSVEESITFRHPLVRSAVYGAATASDRRATHLALATVTDERVDPDRRAWHLAAATAGQDEAVAAELELSAGRAHARGGLAAMAAFLQRSVALSTDGSRRADRAVAAAEASLQAGDLDAARRYAEIAEREARSDSQSARAHLVQSQISFASGLNDEALPLLLSAARRFEPLDMELARETYLVAWGSAALIAADRDNLTTISHAIAALPPVAGEPRPIDLVLEGCASLVVEGRATAIPILQRAAAAISDLPDRDILKWGWQAAGVSAAIWDDQLMLDMYTREVAVLRAAGALTELPIHLISLGVATSWSGDFAAADAIVAEADLAAAATGIPLAPNAKLMLSAMRGREADAWPLIATTIERAGAARQLMGVTCANWAAAILYNGLARYDDAMKAALVCTQIAELWVSVWVLPELIEAAVRIDEEKIARDALERLVDATLPCNTDWAQGILARSRALLGEGPDTGALYSEAVERLGRTNLRPELARAHLVYGEWLRRRGQRVDARIQLRAAHEIFASIGMEAFAERARRELLATGETVRKRTAEAAASDELTAQEQQIALLARDGLSNPEIGARLFLSPRTVEWHLRKIFLKLAITSRRQLRNALSRTSRESTSP